MKSPRQFPAGPAWIVALALLVMLVPACGGGGGGGSGVGGAGLVLLSFSEDAVDNAVLNSRLEFTFSDAVDVGSVGAVSIQIREGGEFGLSVPGLFITQGSKVIFEPALATLCDQSDSGFKPDTQYRVTLIGFPEEFSVRNLSGRALSDTQTYEFHTRLDTDPQKYADQIPGVGPAVVSTTPADHAAAVAVQPGNKIEIVLSENVDPCTIDDQSVLVHMYEGGNPATQTPVPGSSPVRYSGFDAGGSVEDQDPSPFSWGATGTTSYAANPRKILCNIRLQQDFHSARLVITPLFGYSANPAQNASLFPENALIVVQLTFDIQDYGGLPMTPRIFSFTTENTASGSSSYKIENKGETAYLDSLTTAAVDPDPRAPERVQAYMLFAGDGDNGANMLQPSLPKTPASGCTLDRQPNDGVTDDFDPAADVLLDTGSTVNTCNNATDGSKAVVWEFNTFRIRNGVTVRVIGRNPAILLVQGEVLIENGGRLLVYGDGVNGSPQGDGQVGIRRYTGYGGTDRGAAGGTGVAGGGKGGDSTKVDEGYNGGAWAYGQDGFSGVGSPDYDPSMDPLGPGHGGAGAGGAGAPNGGTGVSNPWDGTPGAGGGGGHATPGIMGQTASGTNYPLKLPARSFAGSTYGEDPSRLLLPEAGSGGGSGGANTFYGYTTSTAYGASSGAGGAGGGFLDLTSSGPMVILGGIYAVGGRGGNGDSYSNIAFSSGGGGGSGGGIRLLTPNNITVSPTTVVSTAGGPGGTGYLPYSYNTGRNDGGAGGTGRIAMEDGDSIVSGLAGANITPSEGTPGFYRGSFDANRFQGGGLTPKAVTDLIPVGNYSGLDPTFLDPVQSYGGQEDFKAGIPAIGNPGPGIAAITVEVRGYQMKADGTADLATQTPWFAVGEFRDGGVETQPTWFNGGGFSALNAWGAGGYEFIQVRFSFLLPAGIGPFDAGAYVDDWTIHFTYDN